MAASRERRSSPARRCHSWVCAVLLAVLAALLDSHTLSSGLSAPMGGQRSRSLVVEAYSLGRLFGSTAGIREDLLWTIDQENNTVALAADLNEEEAERARSVVVRMLAALYERDLLPFRTRNYARTKGVLDRAPLEKFMTLANEQLESVGELENCLEWGPYFTRWPNVTQPYMRKFNCKTQWTFHHDAAAPRVRTILGQTVYGELDNRISDQGLDEVKGRFDLVVIPQTLQYVVNPELSMSVLYDLVKPGGFLVFSTPFLQTVMPYPTDYYRFTVEGNELLLKNAGFQVLKSYVGGDDFWSICWIMHCGVSDLTPGMMDRALREAGTAYGNNAYMLSAQVARKPANT